MANQTVIWYWPNNGWKAVAVPFGAKLTNRQGPHSAFRQHTGEAMTGEIITTQIHGRERARYEHRWGITTTAGATLRRRLIGLVNHLQTGGYCAVAELDNKAFAAFVRSGLRETDTSSNHDPNLFGNLADPAAVDLDDWPVILQSDPDTHMLEARLVNTHTPGLRFLTWSDTPVFDFTPAKYVLMREWGSYPCMRIPLELRNDEHLTHDGERIGYLDLPLETDPVQLGLLQSTGLAYPGTSGGAPVTGEKYEPEEPFNWWNGSYWNR